MVDLSTGIPGSGNQTAYQTLQQELAQYGTGATTPDAVNPIGTGNWGSTGTTASSGLGGSGFGLNLGTFGLGLNALGTIGGLYSGISALGLANKQYQLQKQLAMANLNNSVKSYNTALSDRISSRAVAEGKDQSYVDNYMAKNSLST